MRNFAITIGINKYNYLQDLKYAKRDAEAVRDFFLNELNFEKVYHFSDDSPPIKQDYGPLMNSQPSFTTLDRFLQVRFEEPFLQGDDNFWFFFAGHGIPHEGRDYLMPFDVNPCNVKGTGIAISYVTERLRRCGAGNVMLFLDACRSEGRRAGLGVGTEVQKGVITFFSCSPEEYSYEINQLQQGSFTHALLQGLKIHGEGNCATVERLNQYLLNEVPRLNYHYNKPLQTPYTIVEPATKYHLVLLPRSATVSDSNALKLDAYEAETAGDTELAKQLWIRVLAVSPADMVAIKAIERITRLENNSPVKDTLQVFNFEVVTVDEKGEVIKREQGQARYFIEDLGNGVTLDMVFIPGGTFIMGSPEGEGENDERPQHEVTVQAFYIGKYPITQAQYRQVMGKNPSYFKGDEQPVESVSWNNAVDFCQRLSKQTGKKYHLPSEAEWEYTCRAGTTTPFHFGETITTDLANYNASKGKYRELITPVGIFSPNAFGLYDMHGQVFEWCQDNWHGSYKDAPKDGSAWLSGLGMRKFLRGGSWGNIPAGVCRSAYRNWDLSVVSTNNNSFGFRVACGGART